MASEHSRRAVLGGAGLALVAGTLPVMATPQPAAADAQIEAAWQRRVQAYAEFQSLPDDAEPVVDGYRPGERELWNVIDAAEEVIRSHVAKTPLGAMIQLWCVMYHSVTGRDEDAAVTRGDFAALDHADSTLDWNARLTLAAIRSLQAMEG